MLGLFLNQHLNVILNKNQQLLVINVYHHLIALFQMR